MKGCVGALMDGIIGLGRRGYRTDAAAVRRQLQDKLKR